MIIAGLVMGTSEYVTGLLKATASRFISSPEGFSSSVWWELNLFTVIL